MFNSRIILTIILKKKNLYLRIEKENHAKKKVLKKWNCIVKTYEAWCNWHIAMFDLAFI